MRKVDAGNTEVQRARILDAAVHCLELKGIAKTSINDICREAGMRPGHLYYYFPSKDAVFAAVLLRDREYILDLIGHMFDGPDIPGQIIDVHIKANDLRQSFGLSPITRIELTTYLSRIDHLDDLLQGGTIERVPTRAMTLATQAAIADGRLPGKTDVVAFVDAIILVWQGLSYSRITPDLDPVRLGQSARQLLEAQLAAWAEPGIGNS